MTDSNPILNITHLPGYGPVPSEQTYLYNDGDLEKRIINFMSVQHIINEDGWVEPRKDLLDLIEARYGEDFRDFIHEAVTLYLNPFVPDNSDDDHEFVNPRSPFNIRKFIQCIISDIQCFTLGGIVHYIRLNERTSDGDR